ncbi:uncharacterized protein SCHCODRAFT_02566359 [Schizophyllum commune H4-8]|uniref:Expressed protein n=1 Tax=Schizophyllum commune (strain H4-8 / FGSC 9210) TaxID=578458 RepID=D8PPU8_SCHCM|nr:uncharacterized protein SCHCODRAFT_02566359 [Schizophyllum commune H4-8]KAI5898298.1 hypothetical protein SCHCODRAFT_02566359 [Schizophyllum commune H4-8]
MEKGPGTHFGSCPRPALPRRKPPPAATPPAPDGSHLRSIIARQPPACAPPHRQGLPPISNPHKPPRKSTTVLPLSDVPNQPKGPRTQIA